MKIQQIDHLVRQEQELGHLANTGTGTEATWKVQEQEQDGGIRMLGEMRECEWR